jgi:hypothetical protein
VGGFIAFEVTRTAYSLATAIKKILSKPEKKQLPNPTAMDAD